ncbi:DUF1080 domain-containing protein [Luteolibacter sp. LG18]|uniref:3-keto-disaccharide hydrolase n=1 Tax=Luteolibacter sp. LG18 TaxID=2819286 RepID=UPI002B2D9683|nr:glycosyl hydrolase [Luteolibacter sp. LG18]
MKNITLFLALALPAFAGEPNQLTPAEKADGFKLLFDGKTTEGWRNYKQDKPSDKTTVTDGAISLVKGSGNLISKDQFENFEFRFQFKIAANGNSGIMWHVSEAKGQPYETGPEYQILDSLGTGYEHELKKGNIAGNFYDIIPGKKEWAKPAGEWNDGSIKIVGTKVTLTINGNTSADIDMATDEGKALLAKSKFATWPAFNKETKGHLCLQEHGDSVSFRSLRIKELK